MPCGLPELPYRQAGEQRQGRPDAAKCEQQHRVLSGRWATRSRQASVWAHRRRVPGGELSRSPLRHRLVVSQLLSRGRSPPRLFGPFLEIGTMVEYAPAVLAERRTGSLPAHILERVVLESQLFGGFCRGEKLVSSPAGHISSQGKWNWPENPGKPGRWGVSNLTGLLRHPAAGGHRWLGQALNGRLESRRCADREKSRGLAGRRRISVAACLGE